MEHGSRMGNLIVENSQRAILLQPLCAISWGG
jgi:hypothetical protein